MTETPSISDLRRIFYGAGATSSVSDAEYAFLKQALANGISAYNLLTLITAGPATTADIDTLQTSLYHNLGGIDGQVASLSRRLANNSAISITSGHVRLNYFTAHMNLTVGNLRVLCGNTAAGATPTMIKFGVYSVAANGDLTLLGSTVNDTSMLSVINTAYTKAVAVPFNLVKGQLYALAILVISGTTMPALVGVAAAGNNSTESVLKPRSSSALTGQTDLPMSILDSALTSSGNALYGVCTV